jgi:hypothetical protein
MSNLGAVQPKLSYKHVTPYLGKSILHLTYHAIFPSISTTFVIGRYTVNFKQDFVVNISFAGILVNISI